MSSERRPYREFGAWLKSRRLARRWTQDELARLLGYDVTYVRKMEWGERRPSEAFRVRLAQVLGLPASSLPDAEPQVRPRRLPAPSTALVGRDREVEHVLELFREGARLVTVLGAPGIGKTRLAIEVALRLEEALEAGACFVPLATVADPDGVVDAIAEALNLPRTGGAGSLERLLSGVQGQDMVLVLDNFEQLVGAAPLVGALLRDGPRLRVLVTSRQALGLAMETQFWVPPLALPTSATLPSVSELEHVAAVALFVSRARMVNPDFRLDEELALPVVEICRRLQGLPLAIELAAATARLLPPPELLTRLGHGLDLPLASPSGAPAHQTTVRAAISWSYELLTPPERTLFARFAVFAHGCTFEALAAVCDVPSGGTGGVGAAASLVGKSLLEPVPDARGGARVVALDAVRAFAFEQLELRGEVEEFQRRHAEYFAGLAEEAQQWLTGPDLVHGLHVLEDEHANFRAAIQWALGNDPPLATRLAGALWRFWWIRGHLDEGRKALEAALAHGRGRSRVQVRALNGAGVLSRTQGFNLLAQGHLAEAATLARDIGDDEGLALALLNLGNLALHQSDLDTASSQLDEARRIYCQLGDQRGLGHVLNCLGMVQLDRGDLEGASASIQKSLELFHATRDIWSEAIASTNLGWVAYQQGQGRLARSLYEKSLAVYRSLGEGRGAANTLSNLGLAALSQGHPDKARALFQEALLTFARLGDQWGVAECLGELGVAAVELLDLELAAELFGAVDALRQRLSPGTSPKASAAHVERAEAVRVTLGEAGFQEAWNRGRFGSLDDAVERALSR